MIKYLVVCFSKKKFNFIIILNNHQNDVVSSYHIGQNKGSEFYLG